MWWLTTHIKEKHSVAMIRWLSKIQTTCQLRHHTYNSRTVKSKRNRCWGEDVIQYLLMGWMDVKWTSGRMKTRGDKRHRCDEAVLLPFTVREAVLLLSPVSHVYSPLSFTFSLCMTRMWVVTLCSIVYFSPWVSTVESFSQVTLQSGLEVSHDRVALSPSVASWLSSSFLNSTGAAAGKTIIN